MAMVIGDMIASESERFQKIRDWAGERGLIY